jgi:hypothetical protein
VRRCAKTSEIVYEILATRWPGRFAPADLADDVSLGEAGLGLDSIEIVELLLDCEEIVGGFDDGSAEQLLEAAPVTIGRLIGHLARA